MLDVNYSHLVVVQYTFVVYVESRLTYRIYSTVLSCFLHARYDMITTEVLAMLLLAAADRDHQINSVWAFPVLNVNVHTAHMHSRRRADLAHMPRHPMASQS